MEYDKENKWQESNHEILKVDDKIYERKEEIANILFKTFKTNSSSINYNPQFKRHKRETEVEELNFETDTNENSNLPFKISELGNSLENAHDSAADADEVHYQLLKHLPRISVQTLLTFSIVYGNRAPSPKVGPKLQLSRFLNQIKTIQILRTTDPLH